MLVVGNIGRWAPFATITGLCHPRLIVGVRATRLEVPHR